MKTATRWLVISLVLLAVLAWNSIAGAARLDAAGCRTYALISAEVVWARAVGADKDKVRISLLGMADKDESGVVKMVLRDLDALWGTAADWQAVAERVMVDCYARRGVYGEGI